MTPAVRVNGL